MSENIEKSKMKRNSISAFWRASHDWDDEIQKNRGNVLMDELKADIQAQCDEPAFEAFKTSKKRENLKLKRRISEKCEEKKKRRKSAVLFEFNRDGDGDQEEKIKKRTHSKEKFRRSSIGAVVQKLGNSSHFDAAKSFNDALRLVRRQSRSELSKKNDEIDRFKKEIAVFWKTSNTDKQIISSLQDELKQKEQSLKDTKDKDYQIEELKEQVDSLAVKLELNEYDVGENMRVMEEKDGKIYHLTQQNIAIANERDSNKKEIDRLNILIFGQDKEMNDFQKKYAAQRDDERRKSSELVSTYSMEQDVTKAIIGKLKDEIESNKKMYDRRQRALNDELTVKSKEVDQLKNEIGERNQEIAELINKTSTMEDEHETKYNEFRERSKSISEISTQKYIALEQENEEILVDLMNVRRSSITMKQKYDNLIKQNHAKHVQLIKFEKEIERTKSMSEDSTQKYIAMQQQCDRVSVDLKNAKNSSTILQTEYEDLQQTVDDLTKENEAKNEHINDLNVQISDTNERLIKLKKDMELEKNANKVMNQNYEDQINHLRIEQMENERAKRGSTEIINAMQIEKMHMTFASDEMNEKLSKSEEVNHKNEKLIRKLRQKHYRTSRELSEHNEEKSKNEKLIDELQQKYDESSRRLSEQNEARSIALTALNHQIAVLKMKKGKYSFRFVSDREKIEKAMKNTKESVDKLKMKNEKLKQNEAAMTSEYITRCEENVGLQQQIVSFEATKDELESKINELKEAQCQKEQKLNLINEKNAKLTAMINETNAEMEIKNFQLTSLTNDFEATKNELESMIDTLKQAQIEREQKAILQQEEIEKLTDLIEEISAKMEVKNIENISLASELESMQFNLTIALDGRNQQRRLSETYESIMKQKDGKISDLAEEELTIANENETNKREIKRLRYEIELWTSKLESSDIKWSKCVEYKDHKIERLSMQSRKIQSDLLAENAVYFERNNQTIEHLTNEKEADKKEIKRLSDLMDEIMEKMDRKSNENVSLTSELETMQFILSKSIEDREDKDRQIQRLSLQTQEKDDEICKNVGLLVDYAGTLEERNMKIRDLSEEKLAIVNERYSDKKEIKRLWNLMNDQDEEIIKVRRKSDAQASEARIEAMERFRTNAMIEKLRDEINQKNEEIAKLNSSFTKDVEDKDEQIERLSRQTSKSNGLVETYESILEDKDGKIFNLKQERDTEKREIKRLQNEINDANSSFTKDVENKDKQIERLSRQTSQNVGLLETYESLLEEKDGKIFNLKQENLAISRERDSKEKEIDWLKSMMSEKDKIMQDWQRKCTAQKAKANVQAMKRTATKQMVKQLKDEIESTKKTNVIDKSKLKKQIETNEEEIKRLKDEIVQKQDGNNEFTANNVKMKSMKERINARDFKINGLLLRLREKNEEITEKDEIIYILQKQAIVQEKEVKDLKVRENRMYDYEEKE